MKLDMASNYSQMDLQQSNMQLHMSSSENQTGTTTGPSGFYQQVGGIESLTAAQSAVASSYNTSSSDTYHQLVNSVSSSSAEANGTNFLSKRSAQNKNNTLMTVSNAAATAANSHYQPNSSNGNAQFRALIHHSHSVESDVEFSNRLNKSNDHQFVYDQEAIRRSNSLQNHPMDYETSYTRDSFLMYSNGTPSSSSSASLSGESSNKSYSMSNFGSVPTSSNLPLAYNQLASSQLTYLNANSADYFFYNQPPPAPMQQAVQHPHQHQQQHLQHFDASQNHIYMPPSSSSSSTASTPYFEQTNNPTGSHKKSVKDSTLAILQNVQTSHLAAKKENAGFGNEHESIDQSRHVRQKLVFGDDDEEDDFDDDDEDEDDSDDSDEQSSDDQDDEEDDDEQSSDEQHNVSSKKLRSNRPSANSAEKQKFANKQHNTDYEQNDSSGYLSSLFNSPSSLSSSSQNKQNQSSSTNLKSRLNKSKFKNGTSGLVKREISSEENNTDSVSGGSSNQTLKYSTNESSIAMDNSSKNAHYRRHQFQRSHTHPEAYDLAGILDDYELVNLPLRELNKRLRYLPKQMAYGMKKRRRTLKNRKYAQNCRSKRLEQKSEMEVQNCHLKTEIQRLNMMIENLRQENVMLKSYLNKSDKNSGGGDATMMVNKSSNGSMNSQKNNYMFSDSSAAPLLSVKN